MKSFLVKAFLKWCTTKNLFKYLRQRYNGVQIPDLNSILKLRGKLRTARWNKALVDACNKR